MSRLSRRLSTLVIAASLGIPGTLALGSSATALTSPAAASTTTIDCSRGSVKISSSFGTYWLKGACGKVTITGTGVTVSLPSATALSVKGSNAKVRVAKNVGKASITGTGVNLKVGGSLGTLKTDASNASITVKKKLKTARIEGANTKLRAGKTTTLVVRGSGNHVKVTSLRSLRVVGASNYVKAATGKAKTVKVIGTDNVIKVRTSR